MQNRLVVELFAAVEYILFLGAPKWSRKSSSCGTRLRISEDRETFAEKMVEGFSSQLLLGPVDLLEP